MSMRVSTKWTAIVLSICTPSFVMAMPAPSLNDAPTSCEVNLTGQVAHVEVPKALAIPADEISRARQILSSLAVQPGLKKVLNDNPVAGAYVYLKFIKGLDETAEPRLKAAKAMMETYFAAKLSSEQIQEIDVQVAEALSKSPVQSEDGTLSKELGINDIVAALRTEKQRRSQLLRERVVQASALPRKMGELNQLIQPEMTVSKIDERLFGLWGFSNLNHANSDFAIRNYRARHYDASEAPPSARDIRDLTPDELLGYMDVAMEIEAPIEGYSLESGATFFVWMDPSFAPFMGISPREFEWQVANSKGEYCHSAWCAEERRHERTWSMLLTAMTGTKRRTMNPNEVVPPVTTQEGAFKHVTSRMTTEIGASSTYLGIALHTEGPSRTHIMNLAKDELKHLAIATGGWVYLFGPRPMKRLGEIVDTTMRFVKMHKEERSSGSSMSNPVTNVLFAQSFGAIELAMQKWIMTLPVRVLRRIYEESLLERQPMADADPRLLETESLLRTEAKTERLSLSHWGDKSQRAEALAQLNFEDGNEGKLREYIEKNLRGFSGAESYDSLESVQLRKSLKSLNVSVNPLISGLEPARTRTALLNMLREYQVFNNWYVMEHDEVRAAVSESSQILRERGTAYSQQK